MVGTLREFTFMSSFTIFTVLLLYYVMLQFLDEMDVQEPRKESQAQSFKTDNGRRWSLVAEKILMDAVVAGDTDETLSRLKKASDNLVIILISAAGILILIFLLVHCMQLQILSWPSPCNYCRCHSAIISPPTLSLLQVKFDFRAK